MSGENSIYPHSATFFAAVSATGFAIVGIFGKEKLHDSIITLYLNDLLNEETFLK